MSANSETPVTERQILLVGPYGVLGTGVIDAVAENPKWGIITAARRLRIPAKANTDSEGNANGIPGRRRTVLGA